MTIQTKVVVAKVVVSKEVVTKEVVSKEVMTKELVTKEVVTKEVVTKEVVTKEVVTKEVVTKEVVTKEVVNKVGQAGGEQDGQQSGGNFVDQDVTMRRQWTVEDPDQDRMQPSSLNSSQVCLIWFWFRALAPFAAVFVYHACRKNQSIVGRT
jgi:hypothetical protein